MGKFKHATRLTPAACEEIQARMLDACSQIATELGLVVENAGRRGMEPGLSFEPVFRVSIPTSDGSAVNLEKDRFEFLAGQYGLDPSDFGREFGTGTERFRVTGIDPRRPKYPVSAERVPDGRAFKFTIENVVMLLKAQGKE